MTVFSLDSLHIIAETDDSRRVNHYRANSAAREFFQIGALRMPRSVRVQFLRAVSYILDEKRPAAVPLLEKIIHTDPEFEPAIKALQDLAEHDPQLVEAHFNLSRAYQLEQRIPAAIAELKATVRLDARHQQAHYRLSALYRKSGKPELAAREMKLYSDARRVVERPNSWCRHGPGKRFEASRSSRLFCVIRSVADQPFPFQLGGLEGGEALELFGCQFPLA